MLIEKKGKAELRTDAVCTGDEDRFLVLSDVQGKETAKTAEVTEDFRTVCCAHAVLDELYRIIAGIDIDAGILIGQLLSHNIPFLGKKNLHTAQHLPCSKTYLPSPAGSSPAAMGYALLKHA